MFTCERCGASYNPLRAVSTGSCPRCRMRDEIYAPLIFAPFSRHFGDGERTAGDEEAPPSPEEELQ